MSRILFRNMPFFRDSSVDTPSSYQATMLDHSISQELHIPIHARRTDDLILPLRKGREELVESGILSESTLQRFGGRQLERRQGTGGVSSV